MINRESPSERERRGGSVDETQGAPSFLKEMPEELREKLQI